MRILFEQGTPAPSRDHLTGRSPERSSTRRAGLRPPRQEQLEELVDLGAVPADSRAARRPAPECRGTPRCRSPSPWSRSTVAQVFQVLHAFPAFLFACRSYTRARTIRYAAVHEKPAEHALPDAPRRRTDSSLHAAMRAPSPSSPDVFGAARAPDPDRDGDDAGKSGASDGRLHQGPIAREEAPAGPHNTRWPRRGSRSGTRRR